MNARKSMGFPRNGDGPHPHIPGISREDMAAADVEDVP